MVPGTPGEATIDGYTKRDIWLKGEGRRLAGHNVSTLDPRTGEAGDRGRAGVTVVGWPKVPATVRPVPVIVRHILGQDRSQVPLPHDEHPVRALSPHRAHPPLGKRVRTRAPGRDLHRLDPRGREHRVERTGELPGPVPDQEPEPGGALPQVLWVPEIV